MNKTEAKRRFVNSVTLISVAAVTVLFVVIWAFLFAFDYNTYIYENYEASSSRCDGDPMAVTVMRGYSFADLRFLPLFAAAEVLLVLFEKRRITPPVSKPLLLGANLASAAAALLNAVYWAPAYWGKRYAEVSEQIGLHLLFLAVYIAAKVVSAVIVFIIIKNKKEPENG